MSTLYFPPASAERPRRSAIGLLLLSALIHLSMVVGVGLASLLMIPNLPSFLYGSVEVAALMVSHGPAHPRTEIGQWYLDYQNAQDAALDKLDKIRSPLPLAHLTDPALFEDENERQSLRPEVGAYVGALQTWDKETHDQLDRSLAKLDHLHIPPGTAPWVRSVIGGLETEWLDRQGSWVHTESAWATQVIDLYDWMGAADKRGALRLNAKDIHWIDARDAQAYYQRLGQIDEFEWRAEAAKANLTDWTAAQTPKGLWQIFLNWAHGYGLVPPTAPEPAEKIA